MRLHDMRGFSLLEALTASTIMAAAIASFGHILLSVARATDTARATTLAVGAARQKMEELRALPHGHPDLTTSPPNAIGTDVAGHHDWLDAAARPTADPVQAVFVRRWSIEPLPAPATDTLVLQVRVLRRRTNWRAGGETRLVSVRRPEAR